MLITEGYREQQKALHATGKYGVSGHKYASAVLRLANELGTLDVLDYGCGNRYLERALGFAIKNYDPCIEGLDDAPEPAELVYCGDVLEHIEPDCLEAVLDDLARVVKKIGVFVVHTGPAVKVLSDGRNAHLIQQKMAWWEPLIAAKFHIKAQEEHAHEFVMLVAPKDMQC